MNVERIDTPVGPFDMSVGSSLVFTAPHEREQVRDGKVTQAETGTGPLAFTLARITGGTALATAGVQSGDPNWDEPHPFVQQALEAASGGLLIDVHMMRPRGFDACLGLGPDRLITRTLWLAVLDGLLEAGLTVCIDWPFASRGRTITRRAVQAGVMAVQVELAFPLLHDDTATERIASALAEAASKAHSQLR